MIRLLALEPLPQEGGWFRRTAEAPLRDPGGRRAWSTIVALYAPEEFSALHRLDVDEVWCHVAGDPLEMFLLSGEGDGSRHILGTDVAVGASPQIVVPAGTWQGARLGAADRWTLVSCVVVPEFRWNDFQLGHRESLQAAYPEWSAEIGRYTRG